MSEPGLNRVPTTDISQGPKNRRYCSCGPRGIGYIQLHPATEMTAMSTGSGFARAHNAKGHGDFDSSGKALRPDSMWQDYILCKEAMRGHCMKLGRGRQVTIKTWMCKGSQGAVKGSCSTVVIAMCYGPQR